VTASEWLDLLDCGLEIIASMDNDIQHLARLDSAGAQIVGTRH
jgi:hypothetical protein